MGTEATLDTAQTEVSDNSIDTTSQQEPSDNGDNSQGAANQEPENSGEGTENGQKNPKFKTYEDALAGYAELEKKLGEQSNELGELRKQAEVAKELQKQIDAQKLQEAQSKGFDSVEEFETNHEVVNFEADEYAKYLDKCDYPEEMVKLLAEYRKNPSPETLSLIEADFPVEVLKQVAGNVAILKGQLQEKRNEALSNQVYNSAKEYLDVNVNKYEQEFKNPAFAALYGEAFRAYGCDLDTDKFVSLMRQYAQSVIKANGIKNSIALENSNATDEIAGLTGVGSSQPAPQEKNILEMTEDEVRKELRKYR